MTHLEADKIYISMTNLENREQSNGHLYRFQGKTMKTIDTSIVLLSFSEMPPLFLYEGCPPIGRADGGAPFVQEEGGTLRTWQHAPAPSACMHNLEVDETSRSKIIFPMTCLEANKKTRFFHDRSRSR